MTCLTCSGYGLGIRVSGFSLRAGKTLAGDGKFWRMNRLHGYGGFAWDVESDKRMLLNGTAA